MRCLAAVLVPVHDQHAGHRFYSHFHHHHLYRHHWAVATALGVPLDDEVVAAEVGGGMAAAAVAVELGRLDLDLDPGLPVADVPRQLEC